jgi:hypothetical protein
VAGEGGGGKREKGNEKDERDGKKERGSVNRKIRGQ